MMNRSSLLFLVATLLLLVGAGSFGTMACSTDPGDKPPPDDSCATNNHVAGRMAIVRYPLTPTVDGNVSDDTAWNSPSVIWEDITPADLRPPQARGLYPTTDVCGRPDPLPSGHNSAKFALIADNDFLYFGIKVLDTSPNPDGTKCTGYPDTQVQQKQADQVELYLDARNFKNASLKNAVTGWWRDPGFDYASVQWPLQYHGDVTNFTPSGYLADGVTKDDIQMYCKQVSQVCLNNIPHYGISNWQTHTTATGYEMEVSIPLRFPKDPGCTVENVESFLGVGRLCCADFVCPDGGTTCLPEEKVCPAGQERVPAELGLYPVVILPEQGTEIGIEVGLQNAVSPDQCYTCANDANGPTATPFESQLFWGLAVVDQMLGPDANLLARDRAYVNPSAWGTARFCQVP